MCVTAFRPQSDAQHRVPFVMSVSARNGTVVRKSSTAASSLTAAFSAVLVLGLGACSIEAAASSAGGSTAAASVERAAVEKVALTGLDLQMDLCTDPDGPRAVVRARPAESSARAAVPAPLTAADVTARIDRCLVRTEELVVGAALKGRLTSAIGALPEVLGNEEARDLGGGVSRIDFTSVRVGPASATLDAEAQVWAHSVTRAPEGQWADSTPVSDQVWHFELVKSPQGTWLIDSMTGRRVGGGGP